MLSFGSSDDMGTQGSGRKRAPLKDRFSAEDEALSSIAREVSSFHVSPFCVKHTLMNLCCGLSEWFHLLFARLM